MGEVVYYNNSSGAPKIKISTACKARATNEHKLNCRLAVVYIIWQMMAFRVMVIPTYMQSPAQQQTADISFR